MIAATIHELKFEWKNIDQIIVFVALLVGTTALLMYVVGMVIFLFVSPVMATWFIPPSPETDISFIMLDRIFGVAGIFNSEVTTDTAKWGPFPNNFQVGLQALFQFYSMALFLVSVLVFAYFIITVVAETALTGTPFGQRFDNIWIPLRVIAALGLLMPAFGGLSSAQYIVLYAAKYGAGLASNAWIVYNLKAGDTPVGLINRDTIVKPALPDYSKLIKDLIVIRGCMEMTALGDPEYVAAEYMVNGSVSQPLLDFPAGTFPNSPFSTRSPINAYGFRPTYKNYLGTFQPALNFYKGSDIRLVFGPHDQERYSEFPGGVYPSCGEIVIPVTAQSPEALYVAEGYLATVVRILYSIPRVGAPGGTIDPYEYALVNASAKNYYDTSPGWEEWVRYAYSATYPNRQCTWDSNNNNYSEVPRNTGTELTVLGDCRGPIPAIYWVNLIKRYQEAFKWAPLAGYDYLTGEVTGEDMNFSIGDVSFTTMGAQNPMWLAFDTIRLGWGGAGVWYNKIAEKNGGLIAAVGAAPYVVRYPYVMEKIKEQRVKSDAKVEQNNCEAYNPNKSGVTSIDMPDGRNQFSSESATALYSLCTELFKNENLRPADVRATGSPNPFLNIINAMFGGSNFFKLLDNKTVHPMAMLSTLGRTLIDKAVFNMIAATGTSVIGGLNQMMLGKGDPGFAYITIAASNISKAFVSIGTIAMVSGIMLYYILPMMPFLYFFFAVGTWVKTIFEAMVGVPLWALAHLSMKGPGLPGTAAASGYFLILEIAIRPIVTVFGLIAAFGTFSALVIGLNTIFTLAVANIFGTDVAAFKTYDDILPLTPDTRLPNMRGLFDQFVITIVYIMIVYMMGTSCFKLIDLIPDNVMRWSGAGVRSFGGSDNSEELVDNAGRYVALPAYAMYKQLGQAVTGIGDVAARDAASVIQQAERAAAQKAAAKSQPGGAPTPTPTPTPAPTPAPQTPQTPVPPTPQKTQTPPVQTPPAPGTPPPKAPGKAPKKE